MKPSPATSNLNVKLAQAIPAAMFIGHRDHRRFEEALVLVYLALDESRLGDVIGLIEADEDAALSLRTLRRFLGLDEGLTMREAIDRANDDSLRELARAMVRLHVFLEIAGSNRAERGRP